MGRIIEIGLLSLVFGNYPVFVERKTRKAGFIHHFNDKSIKLSILRDNFRHLTSEDDVNVIKLFIFVK